MTTEIKDKLNTEIISELDELTSMELGSDQYKNAVDSIAKLIDKQNEIDKVDLERSKQELNDYVETNKINKQKELDEYNKKDQLIKNIISIGSIIIPVLVTIWGTYKTLEFEKTGTVTTIMGRGFIGKLLHKK